VIGKSAMGKSHLKYTIIQILPAELYEVFTSASPLSLFYYVRKYGENALDGVLLYIDEVEASKYALPMLRSLTSQTNILPRHLSVYEANLVDIKIVGGRAVWFTSVKTFGSQQIKNRFIHTNPDESIRQDDRVFILQDELHRKEIEVPQEPFEVAKALTQTIVRETETLKVKIPYAIRWPFKERRFLYPVFLAFIRVIVKTRFKKRRIEGEYLIAEPEDFETAKKLWKSFEKTIMRRVSPSAQSILENLLDDPILAKTHAEIGETTPISTRHIQRLCEELLEEGLINAQKRSAEKGRPAWEYWRVKQPTVEDIQIEPNDTFRHSDMELSKNEKITESNVGKSKNMD